MSRKPPTADENSVPGSFSRRSFMGAVAGAGAGAAAAAGGLVLPGSAQAEVLFPRIAAVSAVAAAPGRRLPLGK